MLAVTDELETWDLWLPGPGANGLPFARARVNAKDTRDRILVHAAPQPYTRERFDDTYNWTVKWNMVVPGATYENTVDNRAWA